MPQSQIKCQTKQNTTTNKKINHFSSWRLKGNALVFVAVLRAVQMDTQYQSALWQEPI